MTFVLTSGGHNAGIVAPPGEPGHTYRIKTEVAHATYTGPDEWLKTVPSARRIVVAGMDEVAVRTIRRAIRAAADGNRS